MNKATNILQLNGQKVTVRKLVQDGFFDGAYQAIALLNTI